MRDHEGVGIAEPISTGIAKYEAMAGDLDAAYRPDEAELRGLLETVLRGTGAASVAFFRAIQAGGGTQRWLHETDALVEEINKTAPKLRRAISNSMNTDAAVAEWTARLLRRS